MVQHREKDDVRNSTPPDLPRGSSGARRAVQKVRKKAANLSINEMDRTATCVVSQLKAITLFLQVEKVSFMLTTPLHTHSHAL